MSAVGNCLGRQPDQTHTTHAAGNEQLPRSRWGVSGLRRFFSRRTFLRWSRILVHHLRGTHSRGSTIPAAVSQRARYSLTFEQCEARCLLTRLVDFDLDGDLDAVASTAWYENADGQGGFLEHGFPASRKGHFDVVDINGDSRPDVITDAGLWYRNEPTEDGRAAVAISYQYASTLDRLIVFETLDFDDDGDVDLLAVSDDELLLFSNHDGLGQLRPEVRTSWFAREVGGGGSVVADDLDRDGAVDLITAAPVVSDECHLNCWQIAHHVNDTTDGSATSKFNSRTIAEFASDEFGARLYLADMDGDRLNDLIVELSDRWYWIRNDKGTLTTAHSGGLLVDGLVGFRDLDGDNVVDAVFREGDRLAWNFMGTEANETAGQSGDFTRTGYRPNDVTDFADINGDGVLDYVTGDILSRQPVWISGATMQVVDRSGSATIAGDSNFDGVFDSTDLVTVFQAGEYEDLVTRNSTFGEGDWNGDRDFDTQDLVFAFSQGRYQLAEYPRLAFTSDEIPAIRDAIEASRRMSSRFPGEIEYAISRLETDYSDPSLLENRKSRDASRIAFVVLMLDADDPIRPHLAAKAREILRHINDGMWSSTNVLPTHYAGFDGTDLHPWYTGSSLMEYSLAYDWLMGAGELDANTRAEAKFRILRMAQIEHDVHSTPQAELDRDNFYLRNANKRFRSVAGVGIAALAFPDQTGTIFDPQQRLSAESQEPFNSQEVLDWVLHEMFEQITIALPTDPTDQGMVQHYVSRDGVYGESFTYQLDAFEVATPFLVFLERTTGLDYLTDQGVFDDRITRMYDNNLKVMLPDRTRPPIGDAWEGKRYDYHELIAPYTDDPSVHYWAFEEAYNAQTKNFGLSAASLRFFQQFEPQEPDHRTAFFEDAGLAVMRDEWGEDATYLMMVATDRPIRGHRQADQGSFTLYANGAYLVLDPGYGTAYGRDPDERGYIKGGRWNWINSALGHSGITVDSLYTVESTPEEELRTVVHPRSTTQSYSRVPDPGRLQNTLASDDIDYAEAHVTYTDKQVELTRAIVFPRHRYFIIDDTLVAGDAHDYGWQLHLGETAEGSLQSSGDQHLWTIPNDDGDLIGLFVEMLTGQRETNVYTNGPTNKDGLVYPDDIYDHTYLIASERARDSRYVTLLDPHRIEDEQPVQVETIVEGRAWKVVHSVTEYDLIVSQSIGHRLDVGQISTDANFLVASIDRTDEGEVVRSLLVRGASTVEVGYDQRQVFDTELAATNRVAKLI